MTYARSRSRIGARPRITRYARNNRDTGALVNPLLQLPLYSGFWGDDPAWTDNPGVGQAVSSWRNGGTLAASGAYLDPTAGLVLPGVAGNAASTPDAAALDITGDIDIIFEIKDPAAFFAAVSSSPGILEHGSDPNSSYRVIAASTTTLRLDLAAAGSGVVYSRFRVSPTLDTSKGVIRVTHNVTTGVTAWYQGTTEANLAHVGNTGSTSTGAIGTSTSSLTFGLRDSVARQAVTLAWCKIKDGIDGTTVLDVDFRRTSVGAFTCSTGQTVTVSSTFNALQATAGSRPTLTTSALLGGRRVVDFDGTDDRLEITTGVSLAQPFEVWAIGTFDVVSGVRTQVGLQDGTINRGLRVATGTYNFSLGSGDVTGGTVAADTPYLTRVLANGATTAVFQDGISVATGATSSVAANQIIIGAGRASTPTYSNLLDGKIAFLGILPAASITATHRRQFALWAASFYSVPGFAAAA